MSRTSRAGGGDQGNVNPDEMEVVPVTELWRFGGNKTRWAKCGTPPLEAIHQVMHIRRSWIYARCAGALTTATPGGNQDACSMVSSWKLGCRHPGLTKNGPRLCLDGVRHVNDERVS